MSFHGFDGGLHFEFFENPTQNIQTQLINRYGCDVRRFAGFQLTFDMLGVIRG